MKIERKEVKFEPITLIIESQMELDVLSELATLGGAVPLSNKSANQFLKQLAGELLDTGASTDFHFFCEFDSTLEAK